MRSPRSRTRFGVSALILLLILTMALPVYADTTPRPSNTVLTDLLKAYKIIRGDESGNLNLDKPITRAEMFTIVVRALGKDDMATGYFGLGLFDDSKGHWADGYLSYAKTQGLAKGDGTNKVEPNRYVTNAEVLTMMLRALGEEPTTGSWPMNVMMKAIDLGIVPEGMFAGNLGEPAIRGLAFASLGRALSLPVGQTGITYFQKNIDSTPPTLTLNQTQDSTTAQRVTVSGTASDATKVLVNGTEATLQGSAFQAEITLQYGENAITVAAQDALGNKATSSLKITRIQPITRIEVTGPAKIAMNGTATFTVTAFNSANQQVALDGVTATTTNGIGTFDVAKGEFKAGSKPGLGQIIVKSGDVTKSVDVQVLGQSSSAAGLTVAAAGVGTPNRDMTIEVRVVDSANELVSDDYGREVRLLASGLAGLTVTPAVALTEGGVAQFKVRASQAGLYTVMATSNGITQGTAVGEFGTAHRVVLTSDPSAITLGGSVSMARIKAQLQDENGNPVVNNTGSDIVVNLTVSGTDGTLFDNLLTIARGESTSSASGNDGMFSVGVDTGTASIRGAMGSSHNYTVIPASIALTRASLGSASKLRAVGLAPSGTTAEFLVMVTDANDNQITTGSVAFQVKVATSNNDPENVTVTIADSYNPVTDGIAEGNSADTNDIIARTVAGAAVLRVTYGKPGIVTITPVAAPSVNDAMSRDGVPDRATSSSGMNMVAGTVVFSSTIGGVKLNVDSDLGTDQTAGATSATSGRVFTLRARLTDASGNWIPATTGRVELVREGAGPTFSTTLPTSTVANATDGKTEFRVTSTSREGTDKYHVKLTINPGTPSEQIFTSNTVDLQIQKTLPATPVIAAVRGVKDGSPGALNYVATDENGLEIDLFPISGESYGVVKVWAGSTLVLTSDVLDIGHGIPRVTVPKSKLPSGIFSVTVTAKNGYGESSPRSTPSADITNAVEITNVTISSARFDAATKNLIVYGSGFDSGATVLPGLLQIRDGATTRSLGGATVAIASGTITFNLDGLSVAADLKDPTVFSGKDVRLDAQAAWYTRTNGQTARADLDNPVTPMGAIDYAVYDRANRRLTLVGSGFETGSLDFRLIKLNLPTKDDPAQPGYVADIPLSGMTASRIGDTKYVVALSTAAANALNADGTYVVKAERGWQVDGSQKREQILSIPIQAAATVSEATYNATSNELTLTGVGFLSGQVKVDRLRLKDTDKAKTQPLTGSTVTNPVASDTTIVITLTDTAATAFENTNNFAVNIYLEADSGWFVNQYGMDSAAIPVPMIRLPSRVAP